MKTPVQVLEAKFPDKDGYFWFHVSGDIREKVIEAMKEYAEEQFKEIPALVSCTCINSVNGKSRNLRCPIHGDWK